MPNWKKVITSGSNGELNTLKLSGVVNANTDTDKFLVLDSAGNVDFRTGANVLSDIGGVGSSNFTTTSSSLASRITSNDSDISSNTTAISTLNGKTLVSGSSQITISSTTGYTSFSSSIAEDIAGLNGAGYVDTSGTPSNNQIAIFTDSDTIEGDSNLTWNGSTLNVNGAVHPSNYAVDLGMGSTSYMTIGGTYGGVHFHGGASTNGTLAVGATAGQPYGGAGLEINNAANANDNSYIRLAASSSGASGAQAYWSFGINASDNSHDFIFTNYSTLTGASPAFTISKSTNQVKIGSLVVSGSGTFKNIGPAQFSGSINIRTTDQVAATIDTDKFMVLDGDQIKYRTGAEVLSDIGGQSTSNSVTTDGVQTISGAKTFSANLKATNGTEVTGSLNVNGGVTIWNTGDPKLTFQTQGGANDYSVGIDDSDSDKFKISRSSTLGTNDIYKYNYNGGNPNHTFNGDVVLTNSNVGLTGGQLVKINPSGFLVPAVANTDYVPTGSTPDIYVINPVQTFVDFKGVSGGALPFGGINDPQPIDRAYGVWIAPAAGYIEKIYVSPELLNTNADNFSIQPYKNGSTLSSTVTELLSSPGNNVEFTFGTGASGYDFSANDRISLFLDKNTNTSDLYAIQVVFRVNNQ